MRWWIKFLDCLFLSIAVIDFYDSLVLYPAIIIPALSHFQPTLFFINQGLTIACILFALIFPFLYNDTTKANDWMKDSLSWKNIYLEDYGRATFSPNP